MWYVGITEEVSLTIYNVWLDREKGLEHVREKSHKHENNLLNKKFFSCNVATCCHIYALSSLPRKTEGLIKMDFNQVNYYCLLSETRFVAGGHALFATTSFEICISR